VREPDYLAHTFIWGGASGPYAVKTGEGKEGGNYGRAFPKGKVRRMWDGKVRGEKKKKKKKTKKKKKKKETKNPLRP